MSWMDSSDKKKELHLGIALIGAVSAVVYAGFDIIVHAAHFDIAAYGQGFGWLLGGVGAAAGGHGYQRYKEGQNNAP